MFYAWGQPVTSGSMNLQATLSAASAMGQPCVPHHPITCVGGSLLLHEDGSLECDHVRTSAGDVRTQDCVQATVAILLFEVAYERFGFTPRPGD